MILSPLSTILRVGMGPLVKEDVKKYDFVLYIYIYIERERERDFVFI